MKIVDETADRIVIKNSKSYLGLILLLTGLIFGIFALLISAARENEPRGQSRIPAGAVIFVFPVGGIFYMFLDWRHNRKTLTVNADLQIVTVAGSKRRSIPFAQINRFCLGKTKVSNVPCIEIDLCSGRRFGTGLEAHRGNIAAVEEILQKLTARLRQPRPEI